MVANWLSERLKPHASKIRVPEGVIEINEADLRAAIERAVIRAINQTIYTPQDYKHPEPSEPDAHGDKRPHH